MAEEEVERLEPGCLQPAALAIRSSMARRQVANQMRVFVQRDPNAAAMTPQEVSVGLANAALNIITAHGAEREANMSKLLQAQEEERRVLTSLTELASRSMPSSSSAAPAITEDVDNIIEKARMQKH